MIQNRSPTFVAALKSGAADRDTAARKLLEITNAVEAVQDGRIHVKFMQADPDLFA